MNSYTLTLSSPKPDYTHIVDVLNFEDYTKLRIDISNLSEKIIPINLKVDWGDGNSELYDNDIFVNSRDQVNIFRVSPLLTKIYEKDYFPSSTALYKNLTAQISVNYSNGDVGWFIIPIAIRSYDYFESIYDLKTYNCNILPISANSSEYQFITHIGKYVVELSD